MLDSWVEEFKEVIRRPRMVFSLMLFLLFIVCEFYSQFVDGWVFGVDNLEGFDVLYWKPFASRRGFEVCLFLVMFLAVRWSPVSTEAIFYFFP